MSVSEADAETDPDHDHDEDDDDEDDDDDASDAVGGLAEPLQITAVAFTFAFEAFEVLSASRFSISAIMPFTPPAHPPELHPPPTGAISSNSFYMLLASSSLM